MSWHDAAQRARRAGCAADLLLLAEEAPDPGSAAAARADARALVAAREPGAPGRVCVAAGHMIDAPDRAAPRFPPALEGPVRDALALHLARWRLGPADLVVVGGARGADILVAELALARGARVRRLLALDDDAFLDRSVRLPGTGWEARFRALAATTETLRQPDRLGPPPPGDSPFARNNRWLLAHAEAEAAAAPLLALLVWDEQPTGDGPGGTSDLVHRLADREATLALVNPVRLAARAADPA